MAGTAVTSFERLRTSRESRSLPQDGFAAKSGYDKAHIGLPERGQKSLSLRTLFGLALTLDVKPSEMVMQTEKWAERS